MKNSSLRKKIIALACVTMLAITSLGALTACHQAASYDIGSEAVLTQDPGVVVMSATNNSEKNLILTQDDITLSIVDDDGTEFDDLSVVTESAYLPAGETVYLIVRFDPSSLNLKDISSASITSSIASNLRATKATDVSEKFMETTTEDLSEEGIYRQHITSTYTGESDNINGYRTVIFAYGTDMTVVASDSAKKKFTKGTEDADYTFETEMWANIEQSEIHVYPAVVKSKKNK